MNPTLQELKNGAAALPASERAELVQFLLRSLDEPDEGQVRAEWLTLARQRVAEVRAGQVVGVPAEELLKTLLGPRQSSRLGSTPMPPRKEAAGDDLPRIP
jgi:putative addiction module component (TIGR02574 family)